MDCQKIADISSLPYYILHNHSANGWLLSLEHTAPDIHRELGGAGCQHHGQVSADIASWSFCEPQVDPGRVASSFVLWDWNPCLVIIHWPLYQPLLSVNCKECSNDSLTLCVRNSLLGISALAKSVLFSAVGRCRGINCLSQLL